MEKLNELLDKIENNLETTSDDPKERMLFEVEKVYTHYALDIGISKLSNKDFTLGKEGIQRAKSLFEKVDKIDFESI